MEVSQSSDFNILWMFCIIGEFYLFYCLIFQKGAAAKLVDLDKTTQLLEPEINNGGGLFVPNKERPIFRAPEAKAQSGIIFYWYNRISWFLFVNISHLLLQNISCFSSLGELKCHHAKSGNDLWNKNEISKGGSLVASFVS